MVSSNSHIAVHLTVGIPFVQSSYIYTSHSHTCTDLLLICSRVHSQFGWDVHTCIHRERLELSIYCCLFCLSQYAESSGAAVVDISRVIPLRKQHGFLSMLAQIISVLGPMVEPYLKTFFSLLLHLTHSYGQILSQRHEVGQSQPGREREGKGGRGRGGGSEMNTHLYQSIFRGSNVG